MQCWCIRPSPFAQSIANFHRTGMLGVMVRLRFHRTGMLGVMVMATVGMSMMSVTLTRPANCDHHAHDLVPFVIRPCGCPSFALHVPRSHAVML